jgi:hypothetical protein
MCKSVSTRSIVPAYSDDLAIGYRVLEASDGAERLSAGAQSSPSMYVLLAAVHIPQQRAPLLADKFVNIVNTARDGKVTGEADSLAAAKATKYDAVAYDDVKVTAFGRAAIATGDFKAKGIDALGKPLDTHERFTDTWVKMPNGQWQCVASHQSPLKM